MQRLEKIFILVLITLAFQPFSQLAAQKDFTRNRVITRIDLEEKSNRAVDLTPHVLLNAWRMGKITGYYPNVIDAPLSWAGFAQRFRIPANEMDFDASDFPCCGDEANDPKVEAEWLRRSDYPEFGAVLELIEDKKTTGRTSVTQTDTRYIRLVWVDPQESLPDRNAVLFKMDAVKHLLEGVKVSHPGNDAAQISLATVIKNREFTGYLINVSGRGVLNASGSAKKSKPVF